MELKLLGPLELIAEGRRIHLGGHRQRVVLGMLALNANRVTSVDQLTDAAWGPAAPPTARAQIQTCVSSLRRLLADAGHPEAIETRAPGYLLHLPEEHLDLARFERLLADASLSIRDGELDKGLVTLRLAVAMWRGEPLADVDSGLVRRYTVNVTERYRQAQLERTRLEIELGNHAEAVAVLQDLLTSDPYSEEPHRLLMLALHHGGRQAEALEVYRRARTLFVDQLGIEPSRRLIELEHMILNDGTRPVLTAEPATRPATRPVEHVPHLLPADIGDFVGRTDELRTIAAHLGIGSHNPLALPVLSISGPAGAGKSALAVHAAHACASHFVDGQLYASLRDSDPDEVRVRLLYSLGVERDCMPDDRQLCVGLLRSRLAGKQILLILDDVTNEEQVTDLLPGSPTCAVIVTSRRRLAGLAGARRIDLDVFSQGEALQFLECVVGTERVAAERRAAEDIVHSCDRLPLALRIAAARLVARPQWSLGQLAERLAGAAGSLDELSHGVMDVSAALGYSQRNLPPRGALLLGLLALVESPTCSAWIAAALLDSGLDEARELLETLVDERLLLPAGAAQFRLPALVRLHANRLLQTGVSPAFRGAALSRLHRAWLALAEQAHREIHGSDHVVAHGRARDWTLVRPFPPAVLTDPLGWLEAEQDALVGAARSAYAQGDDELCWELSVVLASLFTCSRQLQLCRSVVALARSAAVRAADPIGVAAAEYAAGVLALTLRELEPARAALTAAVDGFAACGDQHGYAMALTELAALDCVSSDGEAAVAKCAEATAALHGGAERNIDQAAEVRLLCVSATALARLGKTSTAAEQLEEALVLARDIGYRRSEAYLLYQKSLVRMAAGDPDQATGLLDQALRLAVAASDPLIEGIVRAALGRQACAARAWHVATTQLAAAAAIYDDLGCDGRTAELEPALMTALAESFAELVPL